MAVFNTIHTSYGLGKIAAAATSGVPINLTQLAVGDGGGVAAPPSQTQVALVNERWRTTINTITVSPSDPTKYIVEAVIPSTIGGWTIREFGVFDDAGNLFTVGDFPETYKTVPSDGVSNDLVIRCEVLVSNAGLISLIVDPAVAIATRQWVQQNITVAALIPGGTTGQVLTKQSNVDGDTVWQSPAAASILVNVVEEPEQTIAAGQLTVTLTTCNTTGLAVYIEGVRIHRKAGADGWQPSGATQVVLGKQYPVGSTFTAFQNDPASNIPDPLTASLNLSDVQSAATARTNLGVYSKTESDQLQPAGNVAYTARSTPPTGWLAANGAAISRTVYAALFAAIGTTFGAGDGVTTFNVPDLRGEFLRGLDGGRGIDPGRALGSVQASQNLAHSHTYTRVGPAPGSGAGIYADVSRENQSLNYALYMNSSGGSEARPRNVALLPIIKF